jgi:VWFA-related protein
MSANRKPRPRVPAECAVWLLAAAIALARPGAAGFSAAPPEKDPTHPVAPLIERATVELVLIEAYVTDSSGRAIEGLGVDDFSLRVDSHPKPIASLEFRRAAAPPGAPVPGPERAAAGGEPGLEPGQRHPRHFILFFEDGTSSYQNLTQARQAAGRFLTSGLAPDDQVALASYDRKLRVLQDFTTDRAVLKQAIEASLADPVRHSDFASETADHDREFRQLMSGNGPPGQPKEMQAMLLATSYAQEETPKMRAVLTALKTLVDSLAPYPGYKAILFMGDGVPENPCADYFERVAQMAPTGNVMTRAAAFDLSLEIKQLAHEAAAAGVTLHSVQTTGLAVGALEGQRASRRGNTLATMALQTGGTSSTSNDLHRGLVEAEAASRSYYLVGYAPEGQPDGQFHTVQLRVKRSGARLRWRRGFTRLLPQQARARTLEAAYLLPELYTEMGIEISAIAGPGDGGSRVVDLVIHLPPGRALLVPGPEGPVARLEVGFVAIDESGRETLRTARQVRIAPGRDRGAQLPGVDFYSRALLPRGAQTVTAVVSDLGGGTLGAARQSVRPAGELTDVVGLSIYSLDERSLWVEVPPAASPEASPGEVSDFRTGPALKSTFAVGELLASGFRLERRERTTGVRIEIRGGDKVLRSIPVPQDVLGQDGGKGPAPGSIKVDLPTEGLPAGDYILAVKGDGGGSDLGSIPFRLTAKRGGPDSREGS